MSEKEINLNIEKIKGESKKVISFFKQKKVLLIVLGVLLLTLIIGGSVIRLENLHLLKDSTTGNYIPTALDPFYWLRLATTIVDQGHLPAIDSIRYPAAQIGFSHEIMPYVIVTIYKIGGLFNPNMTLGFADVIYPVIFFILGMLAFFFLVYNLTKSKATAIISSIFLAFIPSYLYRSMAGFSDHEAIGMFAFFITLLGFSICLKYLENKDKIEDKKGLRNCSLLGLALGFLSAFTIASWGGIANFVFMIVPLAFGIFWLLKIKDIDDVKEKYLRNIIIFYAIWLISSVLFGLIYGFPLNSMMAKVVTGLSSILTGAILGFIFIDYLLIKFRNKISFIKKEKLAKYHILYSLGILILLGILAIFIFKESPFAYIADIFTRLLHPFGVDRVSLTVAENKQPYLDDWISQTGPRFFWLFYAGLVLMGFEIARGVSKKKDKIGFSILWIVLISGILFSRISAASAFNGVNFISKLIYIGSIALFFIFITRLYFRDHIKISSSLIIVFSWLLFTLIAGRGAVRLLFAITPFSCFIAGNGIVRIWDYLKKSKDDLIKVILAITVIASLVLSLIVLNSFIASSRQQAQTVGPTANSQWQNAMAWVRDNTPQGSVFVHWWDYGYWTEYLGERPAVADGGHGVGYWDHLLGRYLLTATNPDVALSFMKTQDVSYLLIDPTDIGKYGAYSSIGSDESSQDRLSYISTMILDSTQSTTNANNDSINIYQGVFQNDEDIVYNNTNKGAILLPKDKSAVIGIVMDVSSKGEIISQPQAIFYYNGQQIQIPMRYAYNNGKLLDFGGGIDAVAYVLPVANPSGQSLQINNFGSIMYLSHKVSSSLFAQIYLMNDPMQKYPTIKLAHSEPDPFVQYLNSQGANFEFVYYNGVRGPLKIWKVDYPSNIKVNPEFLSTEGTYAEFDNLTFTQ